MKKLFTLFIVTLMALNASAVTKYNLWICGTQVTSDNKSNIAKGISYNSSTNTLTLDNCTVTCSTSSNVISSQIDGLKIYVNGTVNLTSTYDECNTLLLTAKTIFTGTTNSVLNITRNATSTGYQPIRSNCDVEIEKIKLTAINKNGGSAIRPYSTPDSSEPTAYILTVKDNADVTFSSNNTRAAVYGFKSIKTIGCSIDPLIYYFSNSGYYCPCKEGSTTQYTGDVVIKNHVYGAIGNVEITDANADNIKPRDLTSGTITLNYFSNGGRFLTFNNVTYSSSSDPFLSIDGTKSYFELHITGKNSITSYRPFFLGENIQSTFCIKGVDSGTTTSHSLTLVPDGNHAAIEARNAATLIKNLSLDAKGARGAIESTSSSNTLKFDNVTATLKSTNTSVSVIRNFKSVDYANCYFYNTSNAKYYNNKYIDYQGNPLSGMSIHRGYGILIGGVDVTKDNASDVLGDGTVSYSSSTLNLKNASVTKSSGSALYVFTPITINLSGNNKLVSSKGGSGMFLMANTAITSSNGGTLAANALDEESAYEAIRVNQAALTIKDCEISAYSPKGRGVCGEYTLSSTTLPGTSTLTLNNASLVINNSSDYYCINNFKSFSMTDCYFENPISASYSSTNGRIVDGYNGICGKLEIRKGYGIIVAGTRVTKDNASNVMSGVTYDSSSKTLKLSNASISTTQNGILAYKDLNLYVAGTANTITSSKYDGIKAYGNLVITGSGKAISNLVINAQAQSAAGIRMYNSGKTLSMKNTTWNVRATSASSYGVSGNGANMTIDTAELTAYGTSGSIYNINSLSMKGVDIVTPAGAVFTAGKGITLNGSVVSAKDVTIGVKEYGISVAGTKITSANLSDVFGDGKVSYNKTSNTLTLNNYSGMSEGNIIYAELVGPFTIDLKGNNTLWSSKSYPIYYYNTGGDGPQSLNITSSSNGTVKLQGDSRQAICHTRGALNISNCTVTASGYGVGLAGYDTSNSSSYSLTVKNADVTASGTDYAVFYKSVTLDNCHLDTPTGAVFNSSKYSYVLNNAYCTKIHIAPGVDAIEATTVDTDDADAPIYDLRGVQVDRNYKGIVIKNGKKFMQK